MTPRPAQTASLVTSANYTRAMTIFDDIHLPALTADPESSAPVPVASGSTAEIATISGDGGSRLPRRGNGHKIYGVGERPRLRKPVGAYGERKKLYLDIMRDLEKSGKISTRKVIQALYNRAVGDSKKGDTEAAKEYLNRRFGRIKHEMKIETDATKSPAERDRLILQYMGIVGDTKHVPAELVAETVESDDI